MEWIVGRTKEAYFAEKDVLVVGDFNVAALGDLRGLVVAPGIARVATDLAHGKRYDQILCLPREAARFTGRAGAVDFYDGSWRELFPGRRMSKAAFTFQVSDHLPLWAEVETK